MRGCYDDLVPLVLREVLAFADDLVLYAFPAEGCRLGDRPGRYSSAACASCGTAFVNSGDNFLIRFNDAPLVSLPATVPIPKAIAAVNLGFSFMNAQKSLPYDFCRTFATADSQTLDASLALNAE